MAIDPRLMMIDYSGITQAMGDVGQAQVQGLAGKAMMGDPNAMKALEARSPMMAMQVQRQIEERKYQTDQRAMQEKQALDKELKDYYMEMGSAENFQQFINTSDAAFAKGRYPMMAKKMADTGEALDEADYDLAKMFYKKALLTSGSQEPSNVREWKYFNSLTPEQQKQYLAMKRSQQVVQLGGGGVGTLDVLGGGIDEVVSSESATKAEAEKAAKVEERKVTGKALGEEKEGLIFAESNYPVMLDFVSQMNELNDKATYTLGGRAYDEVMKEFGAEPREAALARTEGIAMINNQVLPMLRRMLGAAFTQEEGKRVLTLYGDPNSSPESRKAALNALMKTAELELQRRRNYIDKAEGKELPKQKSTSKQEDPLGLF